MLKDLCVISKGMSRVKNEREDGMFSKDQSESILIDDGNCGGGVGEGVVLKEGPWTSAEDAILIDYLKKHGEGNWNGARMAANLHGRTDNEIRACTTLTTKPRWTHEEDYLLISSWLNTPKNPITGTDQTGVGFWKTVTKHFNAHVASIGGLPKKNSQCKDHWNKGNKFVTYFAGCYKRAVDLNRSGWNQANYLAEAISLFKQEKNKDFILIHWWEKVKNEPKWNAEYMQQNSSKRTKVSELGAYTSSSNPYGSEESVSRSCPIGQMEAKKDKAKEVQKNELQSEYLAFESKRLSILERIAASDAKIAAAKVEALKIQAESENFNKAMDILARDTSQMSESQLIHHHELCNLLKQKYFSK